jgi:hypothetical protein
VDWESTKRVPQGRSAFNAMLLWAMPTMMASAGLRNCFKLGNSLRSMGSVRLLCSDRLIVSTSRLLALPRAWAYWSANPTQSGHSKSESGMESPITTRLKGGTPGEDFDGSGATALVSELSDDPQLLQPHATSAMDTARARRASIHLPRHRSRPRRGEKTTPILAPPVRGPFRGWPISGRLRRTDSPSPSNGLRW